MKTKKTILTLVFVILLFSFIASVSASSNYLFRTAAIDQEEFDNYGSYVFLDNCEISIGTDTKNTNPANFNVGANDVFSVVYRCEDYQSDIDDYFIDSRISTCPTSGCTFVENYFVTTCEYMSSYDRWYCIVNDTDTGQWISYNYYKNDPVYGEVVRAITKLCPCEICCKECELEITKVDSVDPVEPGDLLTYYITIENVGTADCTGGGVQIKDAYDPNTIYLDSSYPIDFVNGEYIQWNLGTLHPGDIGTIEVIMLVSEDAECGSVLVNKVKYWSFETDWGDYVIEVTDVECPEEPYCGDGIVDFGEECEYDFQCGIGGMCVQCECEYYQPCCGNGILDPGEECEFDYQCGIAGWCENCECQYEEYCCGNAIVEPGEQCDDGNDNNFDDCRNDCTFSDCECVPGDFDYKQCGDTDEGECEYGSKERVCLGNCYWGSWSECYDAVYPEDEICDGLDNDCDGCTDEDLGYLMDCSDLETVCRYYYDMWVECIDGEYVGECDYYINEPYGYIVDEGAVDCSYLNTECRNYFDADVICDGDGNIIDEECDSYSDKPYGYVVENVDCDYLDTECKDCHDTEAICDGEGSLIGGECDDCDYSKPCTVCGTLECDHLDTECRDYHDIEAHCDASGNCVMPTQCNSYTNMPYSTPCGSGSETLYSCYDGNYLGSDIYYYTDCEFCNGEGQCEYHECGWRKYEDCSEFEYCNGPDGSTTNANDYSCIGTLIPPVAILEADKASGQEGVTVLFNGSKSYDVDGIIIEYCFDVEGMYICHSEPDHTHMFNEEGCYDVTLTVMDNDGLTDTDSVEICVLPDQDVDVDFDVYYDDGCEVPMRVRFVPKITSGNGPFTYLWNFGDGSLSTEPIVQHEFDEDGAYNVTLTIWDNDGDYDTASKIIETCPEEVQEDRPKELISFNRLSILNEDYLEPGDELEALIKFENIAGYTLEDLKLTIGIPAFAEWRIYHIGDLKKGREVAKFIQLQIPEDAEPGYYDLRVSISNDDFRRTKFREFIVK